MTFEGLGSMSAMLLIITIITIGAVMALRNKMRENAGINKIAEKKLEEMKEQEPDLPKEKEQVDDVQNLLDDLNKELDKEKE